MIKKIRKQDKYLLIEEYTATEDIQREEHSYTAYDIRGFRTEKELKEAILAGPEHSGKLIPTKLIPIKLELIVK